MAVIVTTPLIATVRADSEEGAEATLDRFLQAFRWPAHSDEHDPPLTISKGRVEL